MNEPNRYPRLFGKYVLIAPLARGGMGELHLALSGSAELKKLCAIKQILHYMVDSNSVRRFVDEAKVMVRLSHGNVVPVFESGVIEGQYYLVMEYIEGKDLRALWNTLEERQRRCPIEAALLIAKEICRGLSYVHTFGDLGLVHRDISPPNVLVSYSGEVKVADFGLAYSRLKVQKTAPGVLFGKLSYMAPEQARRESVDARADIFSVGVILWELATGQRLFPREGALRDQLKRAFDPKYELPSQVDASLPTGLDLIVRRALAKHPDDRYPNAEMMRRDIAGLLAKIDPTTDSSALQRLLRELYGRDISHERRVRNELLDRLGPEIQRLQSEDEVRESRQQASDDWPAELEVLSERPIDTETSVNSLEIGTVLGQRYRIEGLIGEGGMGVVYRATHLGIDKQVAIKVLHPLYSWMPEVVARFQHEAKAASRIGHPNIVEIYDSGTTDDGCLYFAMEYLEGEDLADVLANEGPLPITRAVNVGVQICRALHAAHEAGVVHRDLKPENVFLVAKAQRLDFVKVLDFGVAQNMRLDPARHERLTSPGTAMGTPEYMAPEQAAGRGCDHRADVYAVGSILYEMLAGVPPDYGEDTMEVFNRKASSDHMALAHWRPEVSDQLAKLIQWAIEYRAEDRPQSMGHMAYELTKIAEGRASAVASVLGLSHARTTPPLSPAIPPGAATGPAYPVAVDQTGQFVNTGAMASQVHTAVVPTVQRPKHTLRNVAIGVALVAIGISVGSLTLRRELDDTRPRTSLGTDTPPSTTARAPQVMVPSRSGVGIPEPRTQGSQAAPSIGHTDPSGARSASASQTGAPQAVPTPMPTDGQGTGGAAAGQPEPATTTAASTVNATAPSSVITTSALAPVVGAAATESAAPPRPGSNGSRPRASRASHRHPTPPSPRSSSKQTPAKAPSAGAGAADPLAVAERHLRAGQFDAARSAFTKARDKPWLRNRALVGLGRVAFQQGNLREAETYARLASQTARLPAATLLLGNIHFKRGQYGLAAELYREVLAAQPQHAEAKRNLDAALKRQSELSRRP